MERRYYVILSGTAGSGKTTLAQALGEWMAGQGIGVAWVNLDPAVEHLPYKADVDARDYVSVRELMDKYGLGPNGALLASVDLLSEHVGDMRRELEGAAGAYVVVDTPGQLELFAYRNVSLEVLRSLVNPLTSVNVFLIDGVFLSSPASLASLLALAVSVQLRLGVPQVNVVSKADLLPPEALEMVDLFNEDPERLLDVVGREGGAFGSFAEKVYQVVLEEGLSLLPVSVRGVEGVERLFSEVQRALGEEESIETNV